MFLQRRLPLVIAFVTGMIGIFTYYIPVWQDVEETFATWYRIIAAFAALLGIYSLLHLHWNRIRRRNQGWGYSTFVYAGFGLTFLFALYNDGKWFLQPQVEEAVILLIAAVLVMLGRVPIGAYLYDGLPTFAQWLMAVPNMAAKRGILLGVSLGAMATSLRIIFGVERSYLGGGEG